MLQFVKFVWNFNFSIVGNTRINAIQMRKGLVKTIKNNVRITIDKNLEHHHFAFCEATVNGEEKVRIVSDYEESDILRKIGRKIRYEITDIKIKTIKIWDKI